MSYKYDGTFSSPRYTDDGYISTEVELPSDSSRLIDFKYYGDKFGPKRMYARALIDVYGRPTSVKGYWRYVDTPEKEKRDSGHPGAIQSTLGELGDLIDEAEDKLTDQKRHIQNLERIICGQRTAIRSKEVEIEDLKKENILVNKLLDDRMLQLRRLESRLADSDKLTQEGWISAEDEMPEPYGGRYYEIMRDGEIISGIDGGWNTGGVGDTAWDLGIGRDFSSIAGTYWRPMAWQKSTPENLAKLASQEVVEVKTEDGEIHKGMLHDHITNSLDDRDEWHLGRPGCHYMEGGTANDGEGDCVIRSVDGTWFRRLASKNKEQ